MLCHPSWYHAGAHLAESHRKQVTVKKGSTCYEDVLSGVGGVSCRTGAQARETFRSCWSTHALKAGTVWAAAGWASDTSDTRSWGSASPGEMCPLCSCPGDPPAPPEEHPHLCQHGEVPLPLGPPPLEPKGLKCRAQPGGSDSSEFPVSRFGFLFRSSPWCTPARSTSPVCTVPEEGAVSWRMCPSVPPWHGHQRMLGGRSRRTRCAERHALVACGQLKTRTASCLNRVWMSQRGFSCHPLEPPVAASGAASRRGDISHR